MPGAVQDLRPGIRQPDRKTLLAQARQGAAVLWCSECDHFWREWADDKLGWTYETPDGQVLSKQPGHAGCFSCGSIYVVWENYPEWLKTTIE